jgi:probable HAF family extracellular repeat protein
MVFVLAAVAFVRALSLPLGFTVDPEGDVPKIALGPNGTIAAIATSTDQTFRIRALRWNEAGDADAFAPLAVWTTPGGHQDAGGNQDPNQPGNAADVVSAGDELLVTAWTHWSGAYSGTSYEVQRWGRYSAARWPLPSCVESEDSVDQHAYGGDRDGRVALTIDRTGVGSSEVMQDPERYAPYAYVIRGSGCRYLGRGVVQAVNGAWAAGYRSYLDGTIAADNINTLIQTYRAARWYGDRLRELGPGDALAINAEGFTVGADAPPARTGCMTTNFYSGDQKGATYCPGVPHAVGWDAAGRRIALAPRSPRSVAYAVGGDGTVVGMLTDAKGRHFAFRWRNGVLQRLDDLPHPRGWRFESAYAIDDSGSIAGIGTLDGVATIFTWRD